MSIRILSALISSLHYSLGPPKYSLPWTSHSSLMEHPLPFATVSRTQAKPWFKFSSRKQYICISPFKVISLSFGDYHKAAWVLTFLIVHKSHPKCLIKSWIPLLGAPDTRLSGEVWESAFSQSALIFLMGLFGKGYFGKQRHWFERLLLSKRKGLTYLL